MGSKKPTQRPRTTHRGIYLPKERRSLPPERTHPPPPHRSATPTPRPNQKKKTPATQKRAKAHHRSHRTQRLHSHPNKHVLEKRKGETRIRPSKRQKPTRQKSTNQRKRLAKTTTQNPKGPDEELKRQKDRKQPPKKRIQGKIKQKPRKTRENPPRNKKK